MFSGSFRFLPDVSILLVGCFCHFLIMTGELEGELRGDDSGLDGVERGPSAERARTMRPEGLVIAPPDLDDSFSGLDSSKESSAPSISLSAVLSLRSCATCAPRCWRVPAACTAGAALASRATTGVGILAVTTRVPRPC